MIRLVNDYTFKSFKKYTGPNQEEQFKQKNIFFGYNGKGKTALSKGIIDEIKKNPDITDDNYRFFNKDFIKDNLLLENNVDLKGIVANFGKENVDIEKAIEEKMKNYKDISFIQKEKEQAEQNIKNEQLEKDSIEKEDPVNNFQDSSVQVLNLKIMASTVI